MFWARRISGLAIIVPLIMHLMIFSASNAEVYRLKVFTTGRMISQVMLVVTMALHVLINVRPALTAFGVKSFKAFTADLVIILSVIMILAGAAFVIYWLRWAAV